MQLNNVKETINTGKARFGELTFFLANYIKVNLSTRFAIADFIENDGTIEGLRIMIDDEVETGEAKIGMGQGPTTVKVKLF